MTTPSNFQPAGWHTVTPRIIVHGAEKLVEFVKHVFGATGQYHSQAPAELQLGDSTIMISDAGVRDLYKQDHQWRRTGRRRGPVAWRCFSSPAG